MDFLPLISAVFGSPTIEIVGYLCFGSLSWSLDTPEDCNVRCESIAMSDCNVRLQCQM